MPSAPRSAPFADLPIEFVGSFPDPDKRLTPTLPEIAFLGRSNVGKSTLMNALVGRRIAKTSGTPGKTKLLNVFRFPRFYWLDLPGYGYAKTSLVERKRLRRLIEDAIGRRPGLTAVVWLLDIRHPPSQDDLAIRSLVARAGRGIIPTLTKADKLSRARQLVARRERASETLIAPDELIVTSSDQGTGLEDLAERILELVS